MSYVLVSSNSKFFIGGGGGPLPNEMLYLLDQCDLASSLSSTPSCTSPPSGGCLKACNMAFLSHQVKSAEIQGDDARDGVSWTV